MDQEKIIEILNRHVFNEDKAALIQAIATNPDRFVGVFRSTTPHLKLLQYVLQSREIRFGDAMEEIIAALLAKMGFVNLPKNLITREGEELTCDQYFTTANRNPFYLMEQKVRDDHDSTKKRGQAANFRRKLIHLRAIHGDSLVGIVYFIDPSLHKNESFYRDEIEALQDELGITVYLLYNGEFFQHLEGHTRNWDLLVSSLQAWRDIVPEHISLDYDADPGTTLAELSPITGGVWRKLIVNDALWSGGVVKTLFPNGRTLRGLQNLFLQTGAARFRVGRTSSTYSQLADLLKHQIDRFYPPDT